MKRVCIYGGPSTGKSRLAARLFSDEHFIHKPIELVDEAIKGMAWRKVLPEGFDQPWLFGKQMHREDIVLRSGGGVITSGALLQQVVYAQVNNDPCTAPLRRLASIFEKRWPGIHILLYRDVPYQPAGRYDMTMEQAQAVDAAIGQTLADSAVPYCVFRPSEYEAIVSYILREGF